MHRKRPSLLDRVTPLCISSLLILVLGGSGFSRNEGQGDERSSSPDKKRYLAFFIRADAYRNMPTEYRALYVQGWLDSRMNQGVTGGNASVIKAYRDCTRDKTSTQITAIVDKYIEGHPETWDHPAATEADDTLENVCPSLHEALVEMWQSRIKSR